MGPGTGQSTLNLSQKGVSGGGCQPSAAALTACRVPSCLAGMFDEAGLGCKPPGGTSWRSNSTLPSPNRTVSAAAPVRIVFQYDRYLLRHPTLLGCGSYLHRTDQPRRDSHTAASRSQRKAKTWPKSGQKEQATATWMTVALRLTTPRRLGDPILPDSQIAGDLAAWISALPSFQWRVALHICRDRCRR